MTHLRIINPDTGLPEMTMAWFEAGQFDGLHQHFSFKAVRRGSTPHFQNYRCAC